MYFAMHLKSMVRNGHSFKDYICPDTMEFHKDYFRMGEKFGRVLFLKDYASYIKDSLVSELCELNRNINDEFLIDSTGGKNSVQIRKHWGIDTAEWKWVCFGRPTS